MDIPLCFTFTARLSVQITAALENGCLTVEGCEAGEAVEEFWGDEDYEYGYRFDEENTDRLFRLLCRDGEPREKALLRCFHGTDACYELQAFCEAHGIRYRYWSWI